jgi:DUF3024 family protein
MATRNARVSDLAVAKVRSFCDQRVPAEARDEVCLEVTTRAATITIVERRSLWQGGPGAWTRMPIAQLRYDTAAGIWTMYWADRNRRWHRYDDLDPTPQLDDLLKEIDEDPLSMFWG